jgi:Zn-dependent M28 family amino/carboxypeptidase
MSLAIAEALAEAPERPAHSVLFLFFTGEERGLLGSDFYVSRPAWPLDRTLVVVNLDAGAPPAPPVSWRLAGADSARGTGALALEIGRRRGWQVGTSPASANSDYFPFYREGVPAVFIVPGPEPYQGLSADSSKVLRGRWDHYHEAADEWSDDFPFAGLGRYAEFALELVLAADRGGGRDR